MHRAVQSRDAVPGTPSPGTFRQSAWLPPIHTSMPFDPPCAPARRPEAKTRQTLTDISFPLRPAPALLAGLGGRRFQPLHPDPGADPAAGAGRARRRRPGPDRHRQDARVPDHGDQPPAHPPGAGRAQTEDPRADPRPDPRELAIQIHKDALKFAADLGLKFALVYGGVDYDKQRAPCCRPAPT